MSTTTKLKVDDIVEAVKGMTMVEVSELVKKLEEEFGVSAQAPVALQAVGGGDTGEGETGGPTEQTEFSVILVSAGGNKIPVIKEVRGITGLSLKETKDLVEAGGKPIKEKVSKEEAEQLKEKLEGVGATVEIK